MGLAYHLVGQLIWSGHSSGGNLEIVDSVNDVGAQLLKDIVVLGSYLPVLAQSHHVHNDLSEKEWNFRAIK